MTCPPRFTETTLMDGRQLLALNGTRYDDSEAIHYPPARPARWRTARPNYHVALTRRSSRRVRRRCSHCRRRSSSPRTGKPNRMANSTPPIAGCSAGVPRLTAWLLAPGSALPSHSQALALPAHLLRAPPCPGTRPAVWLLGAPVQLHARRPRAPQPPCVHRPGARRRKI